MSVNIAGGLIRIEFNNSVMPVFLERKNKDYVLYGEYNNFPNFVIDLSNKHPVHAAILKAKVKFVSGKGLAVKTEDYKSVLDAVRAEAFLAMANRYEDWTSVYNKTVDSLEKFNGYYWQVIWNLGGTRAEVYLLQFAKCRVSKCGTKILYSDKWLNEEGKPLNNPEYKEFPIFNPNIRKGTQVYFYKVTDQYYDGLGDTYPLPEYAGAMLNVYTDIAIAEFQNNLALNGMTAQGMLSLFKGEPTEDERKKLEKLFNRKFTGPSGSSVMLNYAEDGDKGAEWTTFQTSDLDKQFELISKNNKENIISGHQIPNKSLVGISVEGALSDRTAINVSFEQFMNTYVEARQELVLNEVKMIAELFGVDLCGMYVKKLKPLGVDYLDPALKDYVTKEEIREHLGLPALNTTAQPNQPINENLRALSGKDWIHIKRLIREVNNGKTTKDAASLMIRSAYGLSDQDISVLFGVQGDKVVQFNEQRKIEDIIKMYELCAIDEPMEFASQSLEKDVLDLLKGDPNISANKLSIMLDADISEIETALGKLQEKGLIDNTYQPTQKGLESKTESPEVEVYNVYKYVTREGVPEAKETRPFCKALLSLTASGKVWTKEAIDKLSNDMGEDAWTYRGGFYSNPDTGEVTPYCRHVWKSVQKKRRKYGV